MLRVRPWSYSPPVRLMSQPSVLSCVFCEVRTGAWRATARALCRLRAWLRGRNDGPAVKAVSRGVDGGAKSDEKHDDDAGGGGGLVQQTVQLAPITHGLQLAPITLGADDDDKGDGGGGRRGYGGAAAAAPAPAALELAARAELAERSRRRGATHRAKHAYQPSPVAAWQLPCTQGTLLVLRKNDGDWSEVVLAHFPTIGGAVPTSYLEPVSPDDGGGGSGDDDAPAAAAATATTPPSTADDNPNTNPQDGGGGGGGAVAAASPDDSFPPLTAGEYDRYMALFREHDTDKDGVLSREEQKTFFGGPLPKDVTERFDANHDGKVCLWWPGRLDGWGQLGVAEFVDAGMPEIMKQPDDDFVSTSLASLAAGSTIACNC